MTDKDPKDMTASELLRLADSHPCSMCHLVMDGDESCATTGCASWAYRLADKIDAELAQARELSLRAGAELWAKANGWPDFKQGEDFGAWLDRCALPRPRFEDGEPVQFGELVGSNLFGAVNVSAIEFTEDGTYVKDEPDGDWSTSLEVTTNRLKRPVPEVLGADGLPVVKGETVYELSDGTAWQVTELHRSEPRISVVSVGDNGVTRGGWFLASEYTHTHPETQERIDDDATMPPAEYCAVRGIDLGDDPDRATATEAMALDLLRRQRELDKRTGGE